MSYFAPNSAGCLQVINLKGAHRFAFDYMTKVRGALNE